MVVVRNTRTGKNITTEAGVAESFLSRLRGLMLSKPLDLILVSPYQGIDSSSIHMAFMRYQIDVLWLDSNKKVINVQKNIPPLNLFKPCTWKIYKPQRAAKYVLELGKTKISQPKDVAVDDILEF